MRRTPSILQMEAVECGAAALAMVLAHYGLWVPLEELRVYCSVSRDGSNAANIAKAARHYGLEATGRRVDADYALAMPMPVIAFWNQNHFVVIEGADGGSVLINDPAQGPRKISRAEFDAALSGVAIELVPGPDFKAGGHPPSTLASLKSRITGVTGAALQAVVALGLLLVVPGLLLPLLISFFVDSILIDGRTEWLIPLVFGLLGTLLLQILLSWTQRYFLARLQTQFGISGSAQFVWHALLLPIGFYAQRYIGDVVSRFQSTLRVADILSGQLTSSALSLLVVAFYGAVMLFLSVPLALLAIGLTSLNVLLLLAVQRKREDLNRRLAQQAGKVSGTSIAGLQAIETLKATGSENDFFKIWAGYFANMFNAEQELSSLSLRLDQAPRLLNALIHAAVLCGGGVLIILGDLTIGGLVAFQLVLGNFTSPITQLVDFSRQLQEVKADLARIDDVMHHRRDAFFRDGTKPAAAQVGKLSGKLEIRNLSFGYNPLLPPLIEDFSLTIKPGSRVALVGGSGSGKSTIAKIILGIFQPTNGEILFDDVPLDQMDREVFVQSISYVGQEIYLFEGSVKDNISMWNDQIPFENVRRAAIDADIHDVIAARAGGYESAVAEDGRNFSGGQSQRIEIARALAGDPTLLILDEATSALDPLSEKSIDDKLRQRGCSCIIIAHRLSTIRDADEIVVIDFGKVVERGTHDDLIALGGRYAEMVGLA